MPDVLFADPAAAAPRPTPAAYTPAIKLIVHDRRDPRSPACFRSDERLWCADVECAWRERCRRLVAVWKR